jgi:hypothetical protein
MKLVELPHKVCGMTCMVNGLEDLYEARTGVRLPDWLLFYVSGMAGFTYLKFKHSPAPRLVGWGTTPKYQYKTLEGIVGFTWSAVEGRSFSFAFERARQHVDQGSPVILGAVDMYHLAYYGQFYHQHHIPIHYVLMVGYDDEREVVLVHDCDRPDVQEIPYADLQLAWDVDVPGLSKKNTLFVFEFGDAVADVETIVGEGLRAKAAIMLDPPTSMFGVKGMHKLARELPGWPDELDEAHLDASLRWLAEYTRTPPQVPNRLAGLDAPESHDGGRNGFAGLLDRLAGDYGTPAWAEAADLLRESGRALQALTDAVVDVILGERDSLQPAAGWVAQVADLEERAYRLITCCAHRRRTTSDQ